MVVIDPYLGPGGGIQPRTVLQAIQVEAGTPGVAVYLHNAPNVVIRPRPGDRHVSARRSGAVGVTVLGRRLRDIVLPDPVRGLRRVDVIYSLPYLLQWAVDRGQLPRGATNAEGLMYVVVLFRYRAW